MKRGKTIGVLGPVLILVLSMLPTGYGAGVIQVNRIGNSSNYLNDMPGITVNEKKVRQIIYPLFTVPAIIQKGTTLAIKVDTGGQVPSGWSVMLSSVEGSPMKVNRSLVIQGTSRGSSYWRNSSSIHDLDVIIPDDICADIYDLSVSYNAGSAVVKDTQVHCVAVVDEYRSDFNFIHLTDLHVGSPRNMLQSDELDEAGFWNPDKSKRWLYLQKTIREVNLLKPDFVVITGDILFGQMNPLEYVYEYEETFRVLKQFNVPVYVVPGNHDCYAQDNTMTDGQLFWTNYFGPRYFSFNYGPYAHFIGADSFDWEKTDRAGIELLVKNWGGQVRTDQMAWIRTDLEANALNAVNGQAGALFSHHNPLLRNRDIWPSTDPFVKLYWKQYDAQHDPQKPATQMLGMTLALRYDDKWRGEGAVELVSLMEQYGLGLGLHGHTHIDDVIEHGNIESVTTASLELGGTPWAGYRLFERRNGAWTSSYIYRETDSSTPVYRNGDTAAGTMSIEAAYDNVNDGTAVSQGVLVTNWLDCPVTVCVPCYMHAGVYGITGGTVITEGSSVNVSYLLVQVTVPAGSSSVIDIR